MGIILYDLAGADPDLRFSPYCWRIRFALAHKGLPVETLPWRFTEKDRIAASGAGTVPVLVDGGRMISDSWSIAVHLEETYPDRPSLFGGGAGRAHARFVNSWTDTVMMSGISRLIVHDVHQILADIDLDYFRESRERRFGQALPAVQADRDAQVAEFRRALTPVRMTLRHQPWLGGDAPDYVDYIVLGTLQWARCASDFALLAEDDLVLAWRDRGLALFDGLGARARTASAVRSGTAP